MTSTISTNTPDGNVTIEVQKLEELNRRSIALQSEIHALQEEFKDLVADGSKETGIKKPVLSKYLKARFNVKTKETKIAGDLYEVLDGALDGK